MTGSIAPWASENRYCRHKYKIGEFLYFRKSNFLLFCSRKLKNVNTVFTSAFDFLFVIWISVAMGKISHFLFLQKQDKYLSDSETYFTMSCLICCMFFYIWFISKLLEHVGCNHKFYRTKFSNNYDLNETKCVSVKTRIHFSRMSTAHLPTVHTS